MPTLTVDIPEHLARLVRDAVERGDYATDSEAVADALCILQYEKEAHGEKRAVLRREIRKGIVDCDAGNISGQTVEDILREIEAEGDAAA